MKLPIEKSRSIGSKDKIKRKQKASLKQMKDYLNNNLGIDIGDLDASSIKQRYNRAHGIV